jgi:hypothetical protein
MFITAVTMMQQVLLWDTPRDRYLWRITHQVGLHVIGHRQPMTADDHPAA